MKKNLITIIVMALMAMTANAQTVVAEIDWTQRSEYLDLWYSDLATVTVKQGTGLIIDCTSGGTGNYWEPQVPMIGHIAKITGGGQYQVKFTVDAPAAGEIRLDLCSWDGTGATHSKIIEVTAGEAEYTIDFEDYPTECTDAMIFYQCGKIPGRHIIKKVQVLDLVDKIGQTFKVHGFYYKIGDYYTVSVTSGEDANYYGDIVIPSQVTYNGMTYSVTSIEKNAFHRNSAITSVTIPNSVTSIGESAFGACTKLSSITIPNSVTEIGPAAFYGCTALKQVNLPSRLKRIENNLFWGCNHLTSITIPESVTSIAEEAFRECSALSSITIPNSITEISKFTFYKCNSITAVNVPAKVKSIDSSAFEDCNNLTSLTMNEGLESIGGSAFEGCTKLKTLLIPSTVTTIKINAFKNCTSLNTITSEIQKPFAIDGNVFSIYSTATLIVPAGTKSAYQSTAGWKLFQNIIEPSQIGQKFKINGIYYEILTDNTVSVTNGEDEYTGEILIPESVEYNGNTYSVKSIGDCAFKLCTGLTSVTIPNSVTYIGEYAFSACGLTSITIPESVLNTDIRVFSNCSALNSITILGSPYFGRESFGCCGNLTAVHISNLDSFLRIDYYDMPDFDNSPLNYAHDLYLNGVEIKDLVIPNTITQINNQALSGASSLSSVTIPNSVTSIGDCAFLNCSSLAIVISEIVNPFTIDVSVFDGIPSDAKLIVPQGTKAKYQATKGWNRFTNIVEADCITENDINYSFDGESAVVSLSASVKGEVKIKESVEIDGKTYQVTAIASGAFQGNVEITSVVIPNSIETIGASAFEGCTGIRTINIGKAVKEIANRAFAGFSNNTGTRAEGDGIDVYCYAEEVPNTAIDAFDRTPTELSTLHVTASAVEKYRAAWPWSDFKEIVPLDNPSIPDDPVSSSFTEKGINYTFKDDGTLEVTGIEDGTTIVDILSDVYIDGKAYQVTSIGERAFEGRHDIKYLSIPWSVTSIGEYAFIDCGSSNMAVNVADPESWCQMKLGNEHSSPLSCAGKMLVHDIETTSISIPESVTSIGAFTFYQCSCIQSLYIPGSVTSIGSSAFEDCDYLTSLTLSDGLQKIGGSSFQGCTRLQTLTIPSTVKSIKLNAFADCRGITDVYCYADIVPETDDIAFHGTPTEKSTLHVPAIAIDAYKSTWPWSDFKEIVALDADGIAIVKSGDGNNVDSDARIYDLQGNRLANLHKGVNIIKMNNDKVKKVLVK